MPQPQPFDPDASYCVYCHAPAAGMCAACGALCCADCVELVMGLTRRRAICRGCVDEGRLPLERRLLPWAVAGAIALAGVLAAFAFFAVDG